MLDQVEEKRVSKTRVAQPQRLEPGVKIADNERILDCIRLTLRNIFGFQNRGNKSKPWILMLSFVSVKIMYISNVVGQYILLGYILRHSPTDFIDFGLNFFLGSTIEGFLHRTPNLHPVLFPKIVMCNFKVRRLGNVNRYTVQCLLPMNMLAEKMFLVLWACFLVILVFSTFRLMIWFFRICTPHRNARYVRKLLRNASIIIETSADKALCDVFVNDFLKTDGVLMIMVIRHNTNYVTASDILRALWEDWILNPPKEKLV